MFGPLPPRLTLRDVARILESSSGKRGTLKQGHVYGKLRSIVVSTPRESPQRGGMRYAHEATGEVESTEHSLQDRVDVARPDEDEMLHCDASRRRPIMQG